VSEGSPGSVQEFCGAFAVRRFGCVARAAVAAA